VDQVVAAAGQYESLIADIANRFSYGQKDMALTRDQIKSEALYWLCVGRSKYDASLGNKGKEGAYLHWFIANKIRDYIRSVLHYRAQNINERGRAQAEAVRIPLDDPDCTLEIKDTYSWETIEVSTDHILKMERLRPRNRKALERVMNGETFLEIAATHGVSNVAVYHWVNQARKNYIRD